MDITNLSMGVVHPFKNPSTNYVTTFLSVDKLYELASTQTLTYTCFPLESNKISTTVVRIFTAFLQQATLPVDGVVNNKIYILFDSRGIQV
jgi:hypothetical protein